MRTPRLLAAGLAAMALAGCSGGGPANTAANQAGAANAATPTNVAGNVPEASPTLPIDEERLVETCIPAADRERPVSELSREERTRFITCINAENARQLNARLPLRLDSRTLVERVTAEGPVLTHHYRVTVPLAELPPGVGDQLAASARATACADQEIVAVFALGSVQVYRWVDRDGALIREVRVDSC